MNDAKFGKILSQTKSGQIAKIYFGLQTLSNNFCAMQATHVI